MHVRDGMTAVVLTVRPGHTLRQAAALMAKRKVGAAVVVDPEGEGPGIITERDLLNSIAAGDVVEREVRRVLAVHDLRCLLEQRSAEADGTGALSGHAYFYVTDLYQDDVFEGLRANTAHSRSLV